MEQSATTEKILEYFNKNDLSFDFNAEKGYLETRFKIDNNLGSIKEIITIRPSIYIVYAICPLEVNSENRNKVAEYLTRANYGLIQGNFELDFRDGQIRYKIAIEFGDSIPNMQTIEHSVMLPLSMFDRYGDGIVQVVYDIKTPEDAVAQVDVDVPTAAQLQLVSPAVQTTTDLPTVQVKTIQLQDSN